MWPLPVDWTRVNTLPWGSQWLQGWSVDPLPSRVSTADRGAVVDSRVALQKSLREKVEGGRQRAKKSEVGSGGKIGAGGTGHLSQVWRKPRPGQNCIQHHNSPGCVILSRAFLLPRVCHNKLIPWKNLCAGFAFLWLPNKLKMGTFALLRKSPI